MISSKILYLATGIASLSLFFSCTRNNVPPTTIHDTVDVVKHDTTTKNDTLYATKPDSTVNISKGLVLYLPFNGSFADSSGNGHTVTAVNGAGLSYDMHGYANSAFSATGAGERLIVSNNGGYNVDTAFSVSCDFMMTSNAYFSGGYDFSGLQVFLSIVNVSTAYGPTFEFGMSMPNLPQYFNFGIATSGGSTTCSSYADPTYNISDTTNFTPQLGAWYNVVCIYHKNTASVYVNGQLLHTQTNPLASSVTFCPDANFVVGGWWNAGASGVENLRGKLDEVRFYNRVLTPHEITWMARNFQVNSTRYTPGLRTAH
jgi:hypothetical protein